MARLGATSELNRFIGELFAGVLGRLDGLGELVVLEIAQRGRERIGHAAGKDGARILKTVGKRLDAIVPLAVAKVV